MYIEKVLVYSITFVKLLFEKIIFWKNYNIVYIHRVILTTFFPNANILKIYELNNSSYQILLRLNK